MFARVRVLLVIAPLCGVLGCFAISLPKKVVVQHSDKSGSAARQPAAREPTPCDLSDLPPPDERLPVAVLDFQAGEKMGADVGRALADLGRDAIQESGRFVLVDRERIAEILGERDFAAAVRCDTAMCLVEYGKLLGARKMMHGRISQLGEVYVLAVGMTDVKTGEQVSKTASLASVEESTGAMPNLVCHILRSACAEDR